MTTTAFRYRALDQEGRARRGLVSALDRNDAYRQLSATGLRPMTLRGTRANTESRPQKISLRDLAHFTYQFSVLVEANIPIVEGLHSIAEQESDPAMTGVIEDIARSITSGKSVTESIAVYRTLFGDAYVETIRAAESSAQLGPVLARLAETLERRHENNREFRAALTYPICVVGALILASAFLLLFVVPKFGGMFASRQIDLPLPTILVMGFSDFLRGYWYIVAGAIIAGVLIIRRCWNDPKQVVRIDSLLHRIPVFSDVLRATAVSRFSHVLSACLRSGLMLPESLEMSARASGRPMMRIALQKVRHDIDEGLRPSDALRKCTYLPAFTRRMLASGGQADDLARMCDVVARHYDRELKHLTRSIATLIEPVLIAGLAGIVLLIALAIFLPMWEMTAVIG